MPIKYRPKGGDFAWRKPPPHVTQLVHRHSPKVLGISCTPTITNQTPYLSSINAGDTSEKNIPSIHQLEGTLTRRSQRQITQLSNVFTV